MKSRSIGAAAVCGVADPIGAAAEGAAESTADTDPVADTLVDGFGGATTDDSLLVVSGNGATVMPGVTQRGTGAPWRDGVDVSAGTSRVADETSAPEDSIDP
jgi:hypothetical protein